MFEIRKCLEKGIEINSFLDKTFDSGQIKEIRLGIEHKVDVSSIINLNITIYK